VRDFSGLRIGNITPTDVDALIEYHDLYFILAETKLEGVEIPFGQRLALERTCDTLERGGKPSIVFITTHNTPPDEDIDMAGTTVVEFRYRAEWQDASREHTLAEAITMFIERENGLRARR
jgi:hypothetical protein